MLACHFGRGKGLYGGDSDTPFKAAAILLWRPYRELSPPALTSVEPDSEGESGFEGGENGIA